jgi:hypothetical protein
MGHRVVRWLRDPHEDELRARWVREKERPLDEIEMLRLWVRWETQEAAGMTLDDGSTNIINHRMLPDIGSFLRVLEVAQKVVADGIIEKAYSMRLMGDERPLGDIVRDAERISTKKD